MYEVWIYTLLSVLIVSAISLVGVFTLSIKTEKLKSFLIYLISFSAGALLGDVFFHLLPEIVEDGGFGIEVSFSFLTGILIFFTLEKVIHWNHCHVPVSSHHVHPFAYTNLLGDALHNFIDGIIIASSYLVNVQVGIATTIAVVLHEIPQEIGDFGVLLHAGFSRSKALFVNFLSALTAILGAIFALWLGGSIEGLSRVLIPLAAGGFVYIAGSDLIPELHKHSDKLGKSFLQLVALILGIMVMLSLLLLE